ncbi:protein kinase, partial [Colletotrichum tofieldiae]
LWSHRTTEDWKRWLATCVPSIYEDSGIVLILARRAGHSESYLSRLLSRVKQPTEETSVVEHQGTFDEKYRSMSWPKHATISSVSEKSQKHRSDDIIRGNRREIRQLPFEECVFRDICTNFFVHSSIARAISRADVPIFSRSVVNMGTGDLEAAGRPAIVYNCRSSNAWAGDMALTATYFPESRLTFAVLFGCTADDEKKVFNRLSRAKDQVSYPLVLPGIFAELERDRMMRIVEYTADQNEEAIYELNSGNMASYHASDDEEKGNLRHVRKTAWMNTTFLRNGLRVWRNQLRKMSDHVTELTTSHAGILMPSFSNESREEEPELDNKMTERTAMLFRDRLRVLIEEYEDKINECTMSVEGMSIATQWAQGDTNVDIATATGRDSRQMRSIALVTMVFLPGTFFATLFSMTFFNWSPEEGEKSLVSSYIWIYFLATTIFTASTLFIWWYFLSYRQRQLRTFDWKKVARAFFGSNIENAVE